MPLLENARDPALKFEFIYFLSQTKQSQYKQRRIGKRVPCLKVKIFLMDTAVYVQKYWIHQKLKQISNFCVFMKIGKCQQPRDLYIWPLRSIQVRLSCSIKMLWLVLARACDINLRS